MATATVDRPKSSGPLSTEWLGRLLEDTARAFNKNLNGLEAEAHLEAWTGLVRKFDRPHFERALKRSIAESQFFPKLDQISSRIPKGMKLIGMADGDCKKCNASGWERIFTGTTAGAEGMQPMPVDPQMGAVRRCSCWRKVELI